MKIYRDISSCPDPIFYTIAYADAPDGAVVMKIGATVEADGKDRDPITAIDRRRRLYWRGSLPHVESTSWPWPERPIFAKDLDALKWVVCARVDAHG